jgi:hypothetical protein
MPPAGDRPHNALRGQADSGGSPPNDPLAHGTARQQPTTGMNLARQVDGDAAQRLRGNRGCFDTAV